MTTSAIGSFRRATRPPESRRCDSRRPGTSDVTGIDIRVQRTRGYKITGVAIDDAGAPVERAQISLVTVERNGFSAGSIETRPGGHFLARGVPPGDYAIQVELGPRYNPGQARARVGLCARACRKR